MGQPAPGGEDRILSDIGAGKSRALYLVTGEPVLAEAAAKRIADAVALPNGVRVESFRRPADLGSILADLRTYSLFGSGKVTIVIDSAVLSDRRAAAYLIDQAAEALPIDGAA